MGGASCPESSSCCTPTLTLTCLCFACSNGSVLTLGWDWAVGALKPSGWGRLWERLGPGQAESAEKCSFPAPSLSHTQWIPLGGFWGAPEPRVHLLLHIPLSSPSLLPALMYSARFLGATWQLWGPFGEPPPRAGTFLSLSRCPGRGAKMCSYLLGKAQDRGQG